MTSNMAVAVIYSYPVKGLSAERMDRVTLMPGECLPHDRRFAIALGSTHFDPESPEWLSKTHFIMLMRDEQLAQLHTRFDTESGEVRRASYRRKRADRRWRCDEKGQRVTANLLVDILPLSHFGISLNCWVGTVVNNAAALEHADLKTGGSTIRTGKLTVNLDRRAVMVDSNPVHLTRKEYEVLELLSLRKGSVLTKEMFLSRLYGGGHWPAPKIIDVFLCKLRKKLAEATGGSHYIETVWGRGYVLQDPAVRSGKPEPGIAREGAGATALNLR